MQLEKGGFGKVWKVERKKDKQLFAMKEMLKARVLTKRSVNSVLNVKENSYSNYVISKWKLYL